MLFLLRSLACPQHFLKRFSAEGINRLHYFELYLFSELRLDQPINRVEVLLLSCC